jgi:hypothetical protein
VSIAIPVRRRGSISVPTVTLAHGGGGSAMRNLIDGIFGLGATSPPQAATSRTMSYSSIFRSTNLPAPAGSYSVSAVARGANPLGTMGAMLMSKKIAAGDVKPKRAPRCGGWHSDIDRPAMAPRGQESRRSHRSMGQGHRTQHRVAEMVQKTVKRGLDVNGGMRNSFALRRARLQ